MATPKQSDPSLSVDRRQLLVTAAAVTAAGIVPNAETAEVTNSTQAASITRTWVLSGERIFLRSRSMTTLNGLFTTI